MLAFLDKKSRTVYAFSAVGMTVALIASQINSILLALDGGDTLYTTMNLTPACEEILKAVPVLFFTFVMAEKKEEIVPVAYAVGFGFAMLENITFFFRAQESLNLLWVFSRCIGAGLMHGICTAAVGMGMSLLLYKKKLFLPGIFGLLSLSILYHSIFNTLVQSENLEYFGILLPIMTYVPLIAVLMKKKRK